MTERENKVVFGRVADKEKMYGVSEASYHQKELSVSGKMILIRMMKRGELHP